MKFSITKASSWADEYMEEKDFKSLEELMKWIEEIGYSIIIDKDKTIEIYDDWIE